MLYFPTMDVCTVYIAFNCVLWFEVSPGHFYICYCVQQTLFHIAISIRPLSENITFICTPLETGQKNSPVSVFLPVSKTRTN
jgi:hypothetical protein